MDNGQHGENLELHCWSEETKDGPRLTVAWLGFIIDSLLVIRDWMDGSINYNFPLFSPVSYVHTVW